MAIFYWKNDGKSWENDDKTLGNIFNWYRQFVIVNNAFPCYCPMVIFYIFAILWFSIYSVLLLWFDAPVQIFCHWIGNLGSLFYTAFRCKKCYRIGPRICTLGIRKLTLWKPESFENRTFWRSVFEWHLKTGPFENWTKSHCWGYPGGECLLFGFPLESLSFT